MYNPNGRRILRILAVITGIYAIFWIAAEGELYRAVIMGCLVALLVAGVLFQKFLAGKSLDQRNRSIFLGGIGLLLGAASALLTLLAMILKTGLHGHGPEFTQDQIEWVISQIPVWGAAGLIGGLGLGLLSARLVNRD